MWLQYGGNWAAAGQGSDCGQADTMGQAGSDSRGHQDYAGKAYVPAPLNMSVYRDSMHRGDCMMACSTWALLIEES